MKQPFKVLIITGLLLLTSIANAQISTKLQEEINSNKQDFYRVRIEFNDNVDCYWLNNQIKIEKLSLAERQKKVINSLQEQAEISQVPLMKYLHKNFQGEFNNLQQFWIINIVVMEASKDLIYDLENNQSISLIDLENNTFQPSLPVEKGTTLNEKSINGIEPGLEAINAPAMWDLGYTGRSRLVYNYDTGVWPEHPAFTDRFMANFYPVEQSWYGYFSDIPNGSVNNHGTHTLGTIAGLDTAVNDTIGVAFNSYWIANDFVTATVAGLPPLTDMIGAFEWALNPDGDVATTHDIPDVISNSWRWYDGADTIHCEGFVVNLMNAIEAAGIANVFAGGNFGPDNTTVNSPQRINTSEVNTFSVGSIDANQLYPYPISYFSSRGPTQCEGTGSLSIHPEVVAPGHNVRSAWGTDEYNTISGTSMATPHVSGAILLLKEAFPFLTGEDLLWALYLTAIDMGDVGEDNTFGNGLIDVYAAFQYLSASYTPVDPNDVKWDLAISQLEVPGVEDLTCTDTYTPSITITNMGDSTITDISFEYYLDPSSPQTDTWTGTLAAGESSTFSLPVITTATTGSQELTVIATTSNDPLEYDLYNNRKVIRFNRIGAYTLPFTENFENGFDPNKWLIDNPDTDYTWDTIQTEGLEWSNYSASIQFFHYAPRASQYDELISSEIVIPSSGTSSLSFDLAYKRRSISTQLMDTLKVLISTDCGATFNDIVYEKAGESLYTNDTTGSNFIPAYDTDWRRETIDLTSYNGNNILIKFQGVNRQGSNLYLDNINVYQGSDLTDINSLDHLLVSLFPNPVKDELNIVIPDALNDNLEISIYDVLGQQVYHATASSNVVVSTSKFKTGVYAVTINKGNYKSVQKFIKE